MLCRKLVSRRERYVTDLPIRAGDGRRAERERSGSGKPFPPKPDGSRESLADPQSSSRRRRFVCAVPGSKQPVARNLRYQTDG